jgi:Flp pilus assembly protein TadG
MRSCRGQSLAEFCIIMPVLMILALGAVDYGRAYFAYISVTNAARNGAMYASYAPENASDEAGISAAVMNDMAEVIDGDPQVDADTGTDAFGKMFARVTVRHTFSTLINWPLLPDDFEIERTVQMRVAP